MTKIDYNTVAPFYNSISIQGHIVYLTICLCYILIYDVTLTSVALIKSSFYELI